MPSSSRTSEHATQPSGALKSCKLSCEESVTMGGQSLIHSRRLAAAAEGSKSSPIGKAPRPRLTDCGRAHTADCGSIGSTLTGRICHPGNQVPQPGQLGH